MDKILIVESDPDTRGNLKRMLMAKGLEVKCASQVKRALEVLETFSPDLIIEGSNPADPDGSSLAHIYKGSEKSRPIPFLFLTPENTQDSVKLPIHTGNDDMIVKPHDPNALLPEVLFHIIKMEKRRIDREIDSFRQAILKYVPLDLRAPLSAIIGFSEMILGEIDTAEMTDVPAMAENILVAGYRIHERVEKFLTLNELCTQHLTSEFFSLSPTMHMNDRIVRDIISKHYARNKIHSRIAINIKPATMMIHEYYLTIVLKELLENAAQYSNPDSEILVHGSVHDNTYCLSIRDFGIGMNKEEIARLAECAPCRLPADHQSMTHLGLAIVRKVMELCKGEISFDSKKRSHTTVNVYFPMTAGV